MKTLPENASLKQVRSFINTIPSSDFITNSYESDGKYCTLGHINRAASNGESCSRSTVEIPFRNSTLKYLKEEHNIGYTDVVDVNDTPDINGFVQETPKKRVLALLDDMIQKGYEIDYSTQKYGS